MDAMLMTFATDAATFVVASSVLIIVALVACPGAPRDEGRSVGGAALRMITRSEI